MSSIADDENGDVGCKVEIETDTEDEDDDYDSESKYNTTNESLILQERCLGDDGDDVDVNCNRCQKAFSSFKLFVEHFHTKNPIPHQKQNRKNTTTRLKPNPLLQVEACLNDDDESDNDIFPIPIASTESVQEEEHESVHIILPPVTNIETSSILKRKPKYYTISKSPSRDYKRFYSPPIKKIKTKLQASSSSFKSPKVLPIKTIEREDGRTLFVCSVTKCGKTFSYKKVYKNHMKNHKIQIQEKQKGAKLKQKSKEKSIKSIRTLPPLLSKRQKRKDKPFPENCPCPIDTNCDATFNSRVALSLHKAEHRKKNRAEKRKQEKIPQEWGCQVEGCTEIFPTQAERYTHTWRTHFIFNKFDCTQCTRTFRTEKSLRNHEKTHEKKGDAQVDFSKIFSCQDCKITFASAASLSNHKRRQHGEGGKSFKCTDCDKSFHRSRDLTIHQSVHSKEKPYSCTECDKKFTCPSNYRKHVQGVHLGIKKYLCPECGMSFSRSGGLSRHRRLHAGIDTRKVLCTLCGKLFQDNSALIRHQSVHNGQKDFKCPDPLCSAAYTQPPALKKHIQARHPNISTEQINEIIKTINNVCNDNFNNHSNVLPNSSQYDMTLQ